MTTRRLIVVGAVTFLVLLVVFAPASLLRTLFDRMPGVALAGPAGTVWNGKGTLVVAGRELGQLAFRLRATDLLGGRIGYDIGLSGADLAVTGIAAAGMGGYEATIDGTVGAAALRDWLQRFDLDVPGTLQLQALHLSAPWQADIPQAAGEAQWSGGEVTYVLGGQRHRALLPALTGFLDSSAGHPVMTVYAPGQPTPLMFCKITPDGVATVGITKQFTQLVGQPWVSGEPDHAVVLEVGEKLF
jgi:general secretion pathway protein N